MALNFLLKRSGTASKRPNPASMALGELDLNYDAATGGIYYKDSAGGVVKVGPCQVSSTAPNVAPAGTAGNSTGEFWFDTANQALKVWSGSAWVVATSTAGFLPLSGGTMTGDITFSGTQSIPVGSIQSASTTQSGVVQLNDTVSSTSTTEALTANQGRELQTQINALSVSSNLTFAGTLDASTGDVATVSTEGAAAGFVIGDPLPSAASGNDNYFVIVTVPGTMTPPGGSSQLCHQGDWFLSNGTSWEFLDVGFNATAATTSTPGVVQLATDAEVQAGSNTDHAVTPSGLQSKVSDSVSTTSSTTLASSTAAKSAYDAGVQGQTDAAAAQGDATQALLDSASAQATANAALPLAGGTMTGDITFNSGQTFSGTVGNLDFQAKGDLVAGFGANSFGIASVGADGQVLSANSACASGLEWATPSSGASPASPTVAGTVLGYTVATNAALGCNALLSNTTGTCNVAVGFNALCANTTGCRNSAVGWCALSSNTTGCCNTAAGVFALRNNDTGVNNTAYGVQTLRYNTGNFNTATGGAALSLNSSGCSNTATGAYALLCNDTGSGNAASGFESLYYNTAGNSNTATGSCALYNNTTGCFNTVLGYCGACNLTTGSSNVSIGPSVQVASGTGSCQLAIGFSATDNWLTGTSTKAIKPGAGILDCASSTGTAGQVLMSNGANAICWGTAGGGGGSPATPTVTGTVLGCTTLNNAVLGCNAFLSNTGSCIAAVGSNALRCNTAGLFNTAVGTSALCLNTTGCANTASGGNALRQTTTGGFNTAHGAFTLQANIDGTNNAAFGACALYTVASGSCNTALGWLAGCQLTSGSNNVLIGPDVQAPSATGDCQLVIGFSATDNWVTGNSTKAIKPGAGIIDCANSCGTAGQVLMSNGSNAVCWGTAGGGSGTVTSVTAGTGLTGGTITDTGTIALNSACVIAPSLLTAKGSIITASAASTPTALPVGTNGQVLVADSACANGLKWSSSSPVGTAFPATLGGVYGYTNACETGNALIGWCAAEGVIDGAGPGGNVFMGVRAGHRLNRFSCSNAVVGYRSMGGQFGGVNACFNCFRTYGNSTLGWNALACIDNGNPTTYSTIDNVAIGCEAIGGVITGANWTVAVGAGAGRVLTIGNCNTLVGWCAAGTGLANGSNNIAIGALAGTVIAGCTSGFVNLTNQSHRIIMGNAAHTCAQIQVGWTVVSDERDKAIDLTGVPYGLDFVNQINPIAYSFCDRETGEVKDEKKRFGFSAQNISALEVETAEPVIVSADDPDHLMLTDQHLLPVLVNAIKELSAKNDALEARLALLENT